MTTWFTSDHHFGHANIIKYTNRPFANVDEMDSEMIRRWNEVVQPEDVVYHLGDFTLGDIDLFEKHIARLNGHIYIIPGGHDHRWLDGWYKNWYDAFSSIKTYSGKRVLLLHPLHTMEIEQQIIVLCHYAMRVWDRSHYNSWQLYGHSHGALPPQGKQLDVGVDSHGFYPVSFEMVKKHMRYQPNNFNYIGDSKK